MMKVTFCTYDSPNFTGGPNSWLRCLLPSLQKNGIESEVLFFIDGKVPNECPCFDALSKQGFSCKAFPWETTTQHKIRWILSKLSENPPDIFVPNLIVAALYASKWVKLAGIPTIGVLHSDDDFYKGIIREFVFGQAEYTLSALVCVSEYLTQTVRNLGNTDVLIRKIPYGVQIPEKYAQAPKDKLRLIYVGRLVEEQKQISQVTKSLCRVVKEIPNTEAIICGDGPSKSNVEEIISKEGQGLPIYLGGLIDNSKIQDVMLQSHVLVLLSDYEGLPVALMEGMACGLVPICLNIRSGIPELIENNINGLLVNDRNDEFVNAVNHLKKDLIFWKRLSIAARNKIKSSYSHHSCVTEWNNLFLELKELYNIKRTISKPLYIKLPPVDLALAGYDNRQSFFDRMNKLLRYHGGAIKNSMFKICN
ncbi:glycosyl transferase family 1 [Nostoc sp. MBR 210]|nr:glycosyl transferase family 1 [Nostoc sp. MBR 210]